MSELTPVKGSPEPGTKQKEVEVAKQQDVPGDTESSPKPDGGANMTLTHTIITYLYQELFYQLHESFF